MDHNTLLVLYAEAVGDLAAQRAILKIVVEERDKLKLERDHYKRMLENERKRAVEKINGT